jgi:2-oxoglutarate ferredoxin oxidoreductase subunit gamma
VTQTSEIILSGSGGQGLILAGQILAEAVIRDGKNAVQTQSYGPEARGGASKAEVIISNDDIDYPKVTKPDIVPSMASNPLT